MYDGFALFHQFHLEGLRFGGIKRGEALDFYQTDISIEGPNPVSPNGGNIGSGRTRYWMHTDSIQQLPGRAGAAADKEQGGGRYLRWCLAARRELCGVGLESGLGRMLAVVEST